MSYRVVCSQCGDSFDVSLLAEHLVSFHPVTARDIQSMFIWVSAEDWAWVIRELLGDLIVGEQAPQEG